MSGQWENTEIPSISLRGNISDYNRFVYQLMSTLSMQAQVDGMFLPKLFFIKFFPCFPYNYTNFLVY